MKNDTSCPGPSCRDDQNFKNRIHVKTSDHGMYEEEPGSVQNIMDPSDANCRLHLRNIYNTAELQKEAVTHFVGFFMQDAMIWKLTWKRRREKIYVEEQEWGVQVSSIVVPNPARPLSCGTVAPSTSVPHPRWIFHLRSCTLVPHLLHFQAATMHGTPSASPLMLVRSWD
jgi:hypothetical protein